MYGMDYDNGLAESIKAVLETLKSQYYSLDINSVAFADDKSSFTDEQKRIMTNMPFAYRGHVFKDEGLRKYFESTAWYIPDSNYQDDMTSMSKEEKEWENLPRFRQEEFENSLDEYFFDNVIKYGYDFFHYLEFAIPLLNHYETRHRFPRKAYAKALVEYFLDQAQITEITENAKMQIIDILSEIHSFDYYIDRISQVV